MPRLIHGLADLAEGFDVVLCDVWGVLHNGAIVFAKAVDALRRFRLQGGKAGTGGAVVLITNSPNPSRFVRAHLDRLGAPGDAYDAIISSGDVTASLLIERAGARLLHIGPPDETALFDEVLALTGKAPRLASIEDADYVLCTGLTDPWRETPADYDARLARMHARGLDLICANPDIVVQDGGALAYCAGAIAERYAEAGGRVIQAGKPFPPIYERALALASGLRGGALDRTRVLAVGDAMRTDIKGACDQDLSSLFVTSGIHREELHRKTPEGAVADAALDAAALRQFTQAAGFSPTAAIPELVW
ncbi:TIGR01459 family HAD-type hydrolase [Methylocapsa aurea]|uniref:TIGR01459 family HAD-type hydrolase n=1 Tax=Methylocapsa aurea TaxID=663610 RepID=UPI00068C95A8|nr:TIGR01459 family HAD-type hydrolase [Methylocapsa aurea]